MKYLDLTDVNNLAISLESLDERIAMEAGFMNKIAYTIRDVIPNMIFGAKKLFATIKGLEKHDLRYLDVKMHVLKRILVEDNFVNIGGIPVVVPEGMSSTMYDLCKAMLTQVIYANNTLPRVLDYSRFVSGIISSADGRNSLKDYSALMKAVDVERNTACEPYNQCMALGSVRTVTTYGEVTDNNQMWLDCNQILLDTIEEAKKFKVKDIQQAVNDVGVILENLNDRVKSGTVLDMTHETLKSLSAMTLTVAKEVELYGIAMYRLSELKKCYELSCAKLIKSLN